MNFPKIKFEQKVRKIHYNTIDNSDKTISKTCSKLGLLKMISILMPDFDTGELEALGCTQYYTIKDFKIADMLCKSMVDGYINNGDFIATSVDKSAEDYQFLIAHKKLTMKIHKDLYYSISALSLSKYQIRSEFDWFTFEINLSSCDVERIKEELDNELLAKVNVNFSWNPPLDGICASSIAKFFTNMNYSVKTEANQMTNSFLFDLNFPKIPSNGEDYEWDEFTECLGMLMLNCDMKENICSSYQMPEDIIEIGRGQVIHFKGFIPHFVLDKMFKSISASLKKNSHLPYVALSTIPQTKLQINSNTKSIIVSSQNIHTAE